MGSRGGPWWDSQFFSTEILVQALWLNCSHQLNSTWHSPRWQCEYIHFSLVGGSGKLGREGQLVFSILRQPYRSLAFSGRKLSRVYVLVCPALRLNADGLACRPGSLCLSALAEGGRIAGITGGMELVRGFGMKDVCSSMKNDCCLAILILPHTQISKVGILNKF